MYYSKKGYLIKEDKDYLANFKQLYNLLKNKVKYINYDDNSFIINGNNKKILKEKVNLLIKLYKNKFLYLQSSDNKNIRILNKNYINDFLNYLLMSEYLFSLIKNIILKHKNNNITFTYIIRNKLPNKLFDIFIYINYIILLESIVWKKNKYYNNKIKNNIIMMIFYDIYIYKLNKNKIININKYKNYIELYKTLKRKNLINKFIINLNKQYNDIKNIIDNNLINTLVSNDVKLYYKNKLKFFKKKDIYNIIKKIDNKNIRNEMLIYAKIKLNN